MIWKGCHHHHYPNHLQFIHQLSCSSSTQTNVSYFASPSISHYYSPTWQIISLPYPHSHPLSSCQPHWLFCLCRCQMNFILCSWNGNPIFSRKQHEHSVFLLMLFCNLTVGSWNPCFFSKLEKEIAGRVSSNLNFYGAEVRRQRHWIVKNAHENQ